MGFKHNFSSGNTCPDKHFVVLFISMQPLFPSYSPTKHQPLLFDVIGFWLGLLLLSGEGSLFKIEELFKSKGLDKDCFASEETPSLLASFNMCPND